jgi:CxxC-x17-CxxC domain-containing protein
MNKDITFFAKTNFRNQDVKFGIKTEDRQRHVYVIGKTGMGKTTLLENIVMQDIANGHGVTYVDPHGDTAEKLIKAIPANRINDVVYFNPADTEFPIAFNILEAVDEDKKHLVASGMMGVFKKIWPDVWSARMEYILNNAILALLDYPGSTMMGVNRMMSDKKYRQRVYEKIKDPVVKSFWVEEFENWEDRFRKEAVAAIQNKVGQFLSSFLIRNIVGQTKSTINMREIMEGNKILIVNLSKGRIGEDAMRLLGGMIVTKIQLAAMERVDIPEEERKNFYLTVDEFQNFVTDSFANILSEARKYRLNLLVAHQYVNQLVFDGNTVVRDAIFGNVGTIISFRVGAEDSEFLEKEFEPIFAANDIVNLPKYNIYLKLMIDGIAGNAFSATALPPIDLGGTMENQEKVINISRERYAKNRKDIEEKILRWTGMMTKEDLEKTSIAPSSSVEKKDIPKKEAMPRREAAPRKENVLEKEKASKKEFVKNNKNNESAKRSSSNQEEKQAKKELFNTDCDTCGIKIEVPFQPDGKRPTFCKDCLKDYQRAIARIQNEEDKNKELREDNNDRFEKEKKGNVLSEKIKSKVDNNQKVYSSKNKPLKLSQINHMSPKKMRKLNPDVDKIRNLIEKNRKSSTNVDDKNNKE